MRQTGLPAVCADNSCTAHTGGVVLTMATVFLLGVLATNAEPALNVLGQTVESLSGGQFSKRLLVWAVSIGVAVGMDVGGCHRVAVAKGLGLKVQGSPAGLNTSQT